jgi:hypothetical protein
MSHKCILLSRVCDDYIRRVLDLQLDLLDHTQLATNRPGYGRGTDHKENTSCRISPLLAREPTIKRTTVPSTVGCRLGSDHMVASIVACLSVAIATVVNTCHIAYSMHVTLF